MSNDHHFRDKIQQTTSFLYVVLRKIDSGIFREDLSKCGGTKAEAGTHEAFPLPKWKQERSRNGNPKCVTNLKRAMTWPGDEWQPSICKDNTCYQLFVGKNNTVLWSIQLEVTPTNNFRVVIEPVYQGYLWGCHFVTAYIVCRSIPILVSSTSSLTTILTLQNACPR